MTLWQSFCLPITNEMTVKPLLRGHVIEWRDQWYYVDTNQPTIETWEGRPCGHCGKYNTAEGHDGCLGELPGVVNACCGHGQEGEAYVRFTNGTVMSGKRATDWFSWMTKEVTK